MTFAGAHVFTGWPGRLRAPGLVALLSCCLSAAPSQAAQTPSATQTGGTTQSQTSQPPQGQPANEQPPAAGQPTVQGGGNQAPTPDTRTPFNFQPNARASRPYRSIFGTPRTNFEPRLTLEASAGGGITGNTAAAQAGEVAGAGPGGAGTGTATGSANVMYALNRQTFGIDASNVTYADYYSGVSSNNFLPRDIATAEVHFLPSRGTRVAVTETFKNLPEFSLAELHEDVFGTVIPPEQPIGTTVQRYTRYGTTVDLAQQLSKRARANASAGYGHGILPTQNWIVLQLSGDVHYYLLKGLGVYGGYEYGSQTFNGGAAASVREAHPRFEGGIDFSRALSFSRRTTVAVTTGTAGVRDRVQNTTTYHLVGAVQVQREFGRTWSGGVVYARNVRYSEALFQPIFADSLGVVVDGSFSRHLDVKSVFSAARGHIGATSGSDANSYYGTVQFSYGLSRNLALGTDYLYSHFVSTPAALPVSTLANTAQQSVRFYVKVWAPLVSSPRRY